MATAALAHPARTPGRLALWARRNGALVLIYAILLALFLFATFASDRFLTQRNLTNVLRQAAFLGIVATGQTLVILSAGIDLSVGSLVKLSLLISAIVMAGDPARTWMGVGAVLALGVVVGLSHAFMITRLRVAPFIVTLGTYSILRGISLAIATKPVGRASPQWLALYDARIGPVSALTLLFIVLLVVLIVVLRRTRWGRHLYAVGGSEQAARLSGVAVNRVKTWAYVLCSVLAALTGLLYLSRMGIGDPVVGDGLELQAITAVILGGTSLFGGRGSLIGTLGGVLLLGLISNLLVIFNVNQWIQELLEGMIILGAVALYKQKAR